MKKYYFLFLLFITSTLVSNAQVTEHSAFMKDVNGSPMSMKKEIDFEGSPFLNDTYQLADILLLNEKKYQNIRIKINLETNQIIYQNSKAEDMLISVPVKEVILKTLVDKDTVSTIIRGLGGNNDALNDKNAKIVEVLSDGYKYKLYRSHAVGFTVGTEYGNAVVIKKYNKSTALLAAETDNKLNTTRLTKNKNAVINFFNNQKDEVKKFIEKNKLSFKSDDDFVKTFQYANTLQ